MGLVGPVVADPFFYQASKGMYDVVLSMYQDQAIMRRKHKISGIL